MAQSFAEFRSKLLEPAAVDKVLKKKKNLGISETMIKFKYLGQTTRKQNWAVINPGPRRAYKMFEKIAPQAASIALKEIIKTLGKLKLKDFKTEVAASKSISLAMRRAGESVKLELIKVTPKGKSKKSKLGLRSGSNKKFGRLASSYEVIPASKFRGFSSAGGIGVVITARAAHASNVEEGTGKNEVIGKVKVDRNVKKKRGKRARKGRR